MSLATLIDCKLGSLAMGWFVVAAATLAPNGFLRAQELPQGHPPIVPATETAAAKSDSIPELTLEALFKPDQKFDFDGSLPSTHWIGDSPSVLLVRRGQVWNQVSLDGGADGVAEGESAWPVLEKLSKRIGELEGMDAERASGIAASAVAKMKQADDSFLVRFNKGLAVVSADASPRWLTRDASGWMNATIDPTARRVAFTRNGNLFVVDVRSGLTVQLTSDGSETLLNGLLDWTYQEEIYGRGNFKGFWFSPDGQWLSMLRIDIGAIEPYTLSAAASERGEGIIRPYTKPGDPIPHASLYLWDLRQSQRGIVPAAKLVQASAPEAQPEQQRLITGVWWHPTELAMYYCVSDRLQTFRELRRIDESFATSLTPKSALILREESPAWIEPPSEPGWLADGGVVWQSELPSGRSRLYRVSSDGSVVEPISPEKLDVKDFFVKPDGSMAIVTGDVEQGSVERHAYRIDLIDIAAANPSSPNAAKPAPTLVPITRQPGWHDVTISPDGQWLTDRSSNPATPPALSVRHVAGEPSMELANSELELETPIIEPKLFTIRTPDGIELPAMLVRPTGHDAGQRLPVMVEVYGGPQAPSVTAKWAGTKTLYRELLARRGIATLVVDNRSSGGRGIADTWSIQGKMGVVELEDLLVAVQWLKRQDWVDPDRLAIRGWSFGGYLSLYAMTHSDAFAAGIAGGSPTDWREYDSLYTERYMGLPSKNPQGYDQTSVLGAAKDLHGTVLMIHGEVDDNVHPSNTLRMAEALQRAGKDFRLMIYPGAAHAISDPAQAWHMSLMTDRFLSEMLLETAD